MNVFTQRPSCLRYTYSALLRLSGRKNCLQCTITPVKRKLTCLQHVACTCSNLTPLHRRFTTPVANHRQVESSEIKTFANIITENNYARNLFLHSIHYANSVTRQNIAFAYVTNEEALKILIEKWDNERFITNEEILSMFKKLSYNIHSNKRRINPNMYENFFNMLCKQYKKLSDDNLKIMIRHLAAFYNTMWSYKFYQNLCKQLDEECLTRFTQLQINETLLLCDMIYQIMPNNMHNSEYVWYAMRKIGNKPNKLNCHQLVQVLFFLNVCRKPPINMYELEYRLEQCIDELTVNELGIALMGFFKTRSPIRSSRLLRCIMKKTMANIESVDSISIAVIFKLIRYSMQLQEIPLLQELLQSLIPHVPRFNLMTLVHAGHACAKVGLYNQELMDKIIERLNSEIKIARLKDIERFVYTFSYLNISPSNSIYQNVIDELRTTWDTSRSKEISSFPVVASRILGYLALLNIYPLDLIKRIMMPEFLSKTCKNNYRFLTREYCVLDYSLRIEVPEYKGPFLKPTVCNMLEKKCLEDFSSTLGENSSIQRLLTEVIQTCQEMFNTTSDIVATRPLPHYAIPDIVFCLDKQNKLVSSMKFLSQFSQGEIMRIDKINSEDVRWIAIVVAHPGLLTWPNTNLPVGTLATKIRQLPKIGYTPILISYFHWKRYRSPQQKYEYIWKLLDASKLSDT